MSRTERTWEDRSLETVKRALRHVFRISHVIHKNKANRFLFRGGGGGVTCDTSFTDQIRKCLSPLVYK